MPRNIWRCNCPICRITVHKVLNKVAGNRVVSTGVAERSHETSVVKEQTSELSPELREKIGNRPVEIVKLTPQPTSTQTPQPQQSTVAESKKEEKKEEEKRAEKKPQVQTELPPNIVEKINMLETEINKIKKYVRASVDGIKATLIDLRSAMAELSNPFNILRKYADLFSSTEQQTQTQQNTPQSSIQSQPMVQPIIPVIQYPIVQPASSQQNQSTEKPEDREEEKREEEKEESKNTRIDYSLYVKLAQWVNKIVDQVPPDVLEKLVDNYVDVGVIDENVGKALKKIIKTVNELRTLGLNVEEQAKFLKELVHTLGLSNREVAEKVLPATEKAEEDATKDLLDLIDKG